MKNKIYIIEGKTYLNHINDEVHLYGLLHQLAFLAGRIKDEEDVFHVLDTAKRYGEIAEEKFQGWGIPGRYLVFGEKKDLAELKAKELQRLSAVLAEHDREKRAQEKERFFRDRPYIIQGSAFRLMVGDIFELYARYVSLSRRVAAVTNEKELARLQKHLSAGNGQYFRRLDKKWGVSEAEGVTCSDALQKAFEVTHLTPVPEDFLSAAPQEPEEGFYEEYDDFPEDDGCMDGYWND